MPRRAGQRLPRHGPGRISLGRVHPVEDHAELVERLIAAGIPGPETGFADLPDEFPDSVDFLTAFHDLAPFSLRCCRRRGYLYFPDSRMAT